MTQYIILAKSTITASALKEVLYLADSRCRLGIYELQQIIWDDAIVGLSAYRSIADRIEKLVSVTDDFIPSNETVVLVDQVSPSDLNPIVPGNWDALIAMLILTFPEIRWIFGVFTKSSEGFNEISNNHNLLSLFGANYNPLFDGTGLREWVRERVGKTNNNKMTAHQLPIRKKIALAIDEEPDCAYFNAYVAYRFGFRSYAVTEEALLEKFVGKNGQLNGNKDFHLSIEDRFLNFPDRSDKYRNIRLSNLNVRSEHFPGLDNKRTLRVFITSGHQPEIIVERRKKKWRASNIFQQETTSRRFVDFTKALREEGRLGTVLYKPLSGIFNFWEESGLREKLVDGGRAEGFYWPPKYMGRKDDEFGHGAPGKILEIVLRLESRAEKLRNHTHSTIQAIHGAVLAVEAMELLIEKAQTTFLEALVLKHEFEAIAECHFYGVHSHFDVKTRIKDIQLEAKEFARYFDSSKRDDVERNTEMETLDCLIKIYREFNQFDEEMTIQDRSRKLHLQFWVKQNGIISVIKNRVWPKLKEICSGKYKVNINEVLSVIKNRVWPKLKEICSSNYWKKRDFWQFDPTYWIAWYINLLLKSIWIYLIAVALWVVGLGFLFKWSYPNKLTSIPQGISTAIIMFTGGTVHGLNEHGTSGNSRFIVVACLAVLSGLAHFGILLSHIYSRISRK